ncbi:MAG: hypothetical protein AMJ45_05105 [Syntrophobacter sp. DG_60]|nr:MAG: hypothetical protein AMJ45_05105 [Syntrophobacter sp. DG_60]
MKKIALLTALLFIITGTVLAKEQKMTPEQQQKMIQQQMQMMAPMFGQMMKVMMETMVEVLAQQETADKLATYTKNYYDALIKKGFSEDEALQIVKAVGFPPPGMISH